MVPGGQTRQTNKGENMRNVYPTREIAHLWANKTQESARNPQGNFYFDGDTIYSYGGHFPIARHIRNKRAEDAVLFTLRGYSNTTAHHKSMVHGAISRDVPVFVVDDVFTDRKDARDEFEHYKKRVTEAALSAGRARSDRQKEWKTRNLEELLDEANRFAGFFGIRSRVTVDNLEEMKADAREAAKRAIIERKEAERKREEERQERLKLWLVGESDYPPYTDKDYLRVKGEEVQTSKGVSVPVSHAKQLYQLASLVRENGETWTPNGHTFHIGVYHVDRIEADGTIIAGCHRIEWDEAERIGKQL